MNRILSALVLSLIVAVGCDKPATNASGSGKLTLQLNWKPEPQFGGFYAADFKKHGLDVEVRPGGAGAPTVDMLGAGTVPFAIVSADEIVKARQNGNLLVGLFAVYQTNPQGIMTRKARGFSSIADVFTHDGTLAMEAGLPYSEFLKKKYGFDKLKIVPSPFGDLSLYRTNDKYAMQCFVTSEPLAAKKTEFEPQTFLIAESGYNPYTTVLATNEKYLAANPGVVAQMVAAVREGWTAYLADPSGTNRKMRELNPTMDEQTFTDSAEAQKRLILGEAAQSSLGNMTADRWKTLIDQLTELKVITGPIDPQACFRNIDVAK